MLVDYTIYLKRPDYLVLKECDEVICVTMPGQDNQTPIQDVLLEAKKTASNQDTRIYQYFDSEGIREDIHDTPPTQDYIVQAYLRKSSHDNTNHQCS